MSWIAHVLRSDGKQMSAVKHCGKWINPVKPLQPCPELLGTVREKIWASMGQLRMTWDRRYKLSARVHYRSGVLNSVTQTTSNNTRPETWVKTKESGRVVRWGPQCGELMALVTLSHYRYTEVKFCAHLSNRWFSVMCFLCTHSSFQSKECIDRYLYLLIVYWEILYTDLNY